MRTPTRDEPAVHLDRVTHRYRETGGPPVLDEVHLTVDSGEVVGIGGRSGSGKSTLLRITAGLLQPRSGQVHLGGHPVWTGRRPRLPQPGHVGAVFQDPVSSLDPRWTIGRSVAEPLWARHRRRPGRDGAADERSAVAEALQRVGLGSVPLGARPGELSVGQLQRVVLARVLLARPAVLLADEPTSALDVTSGAGILHLLRRFADEGAAVLVISHDRGVLGALCDRTFRLIDGRLEPTDGHAGAHPTTSLDEGAGR